MYENYKKKKDKVVLKAWSLTEVAEHYCDTKSF